MRTETVTPTTTAQSIWALLGSKQADRICNAVLMQAPDTNAADIAFGDARNQPFTLAAGANTSFGSSAPKNVYVKGNGTDTLFVGLVQ